jgi:hypothetical protein
MARQKEEIRRLTEAYQRANTAYEEVTAELRLKRAQVNKMVTEKLSISDKKRNEEMEAMRHEMMAAMKEMLQNTQHSHCRSPGTSKTQGKRAQHREATMTDNEKVYEKRQEKRADRRKTLTKKLIFDEEHLAEESMTQFESHRNKQSDDASSVSE